MKKRIAIMAAGLLLSCTALKADYDLDDASSLNIENATSQQQNQFTLKGSGDYICKAKFKEDTPGHIIFAHAEGEFDAVVWYNEQCQEGVKVSLAYEYSRLDWDDNFFFERKNYNTAAISATYFTHRLTHWRWIASADINLDADKWDFNDYTTYDMLLWGRYQYCCNWGFHFGIYAETGMKLDLVLPVLGFDWQICDGLLLSAVFPVNMSLLYTIDENWSVAIAGRVFSDRHRAGKEGLYEKALWRYSNGGIEGDINYNICDWLTANVHAGYAFGGKLRISSRHNHHVHHERFKGAPYAGGAIAFNF